MSQNNVTSRFMTVQKITEYLQLKEKIYMPWPLKKKYLIQKSPVNVFFHVN